MKPNYFDGISIIIPSYNREKQLCRLLDSIFKEDISNLYEIIIVDNNSDYDIYEVLTNYTSDKIRIVRNPFNVKMATNMMNTFLHCKTKWMWLISDDDVICKNAISNINNRINENPNVGYLKFSTEGTKEIGIEQNMKVDNLEQFIDYYSQDKIIRRGNLVFVSNGVFNLELLYPYLGYGFEFSYTYVGFLLPVFIALNKGKSVLFCNEKIVKYLSPDNGFWSFSTVGLGLSTISHIPIQLNSIHFKKFLNITMPVTYGKLFNYLLFKSENNPRVIYNKIYENSYKFYLTPFEKLTSRFYSILLTFPNLTRSCYSALKKVKSYI